MKARVISTRYPRLVGEGDTARRERYDFGAVIDVSKEEFDRGVELGVLQAEDDRAPGPDETNLMLARQAGIATQPNGEPITDLDGEPLEVPAGPDLGGGEEWKAPRTHAAADEQLAAIGISAPADATVKDKVSILEEYRAAQASGAPTPTTLATEDISEFDDGELIQRGVDFGLSEEELVEKSHDELVLIVAEAMRRQSADPAEQQRLADGELARIRAENAAENNPEG